MIIKISKGINIIDDYNSFGDDNFKQMATQIKPLQMPPKKNLLEQIDYKYTTFKIVHVL